MRKNGLNHHESHKPCNHSTKILVPKQKFALLIRTSLLENENCPNAILLTHKITEIGRQSRIQVDTKKGKEVSKKHAKIIRNDDMEQPIWIITDNTSTNGTFVNSRKIHKRNLINMDEIVFGGGPSFHVGDKLISTDRSDTRFVFLYPLPSISFSSSINFDEVLPRPEDAEMCPICYEPLLKRLVLPCGHIFCSKCLRMWTQKCILEHKHAQCPCCRKEFPHEDLLFGDTIYKKSVLLVQTLDPLIRKLGFLSAREIMNLSIRKEWTPETKELFIKSLGLVQKKPDRLLTFCALTDCLYQQVRETPPDFLKIIVRNFSGNDQLPMPRILEEALFLVYHNVFENPKQTSK